jgi:hypothetical protein
MYDYMKSKNEYPPKTSVKKVFSNGNVDIAYEPSEYDKFTIRFTPALVGGNVEDFLDSLDEFQEESVDASDLRWKVEPAKSGRSTCKTCGHKIDKDLLRLGEPSFYEEHITYRWHHLACQMNQLRWIDLEELDGYSDLSVEQKAEVRNLKGI